MMIESAKTTSGEFVYSLDLYLQHLTDCLNKKKSN